MHGIRRPSALVIATCLGVTAASAARAQTTAYDGVYDTTGTADPQNGVQCNQNVAAYPLTVKNGTFSGLDHNPVTIGPNGVAESTGKYLVGGSLSLPYKASYHFSANALDSDLSVVRTNGEPCVYHRHGKKRS